eukprot:5005222-Pyramimonas_sp.AAC.1
MWKLTGLARRWRRCLFIGFVQNALLSGLESFALSQFDYDILDSSLCRLGRAAMGGKAANYEGEHITSLTNKRNPV